jgi:drug/metabolite transporter (DMT)-like permease
LDATRAAIIATFEAVVGVTAGLVLFGETLGAWGFAGSVLIVAAVVLVVRAGDRTSRVADAPPLNERS